MKRYNLSTFTFLLLTIISLYGWAGNAPFVRLLIGSDAFVSPYISGRDSSDHHKDKVKSPHDRGSIKKGRRDTSQIHVDPIIVPRDTGYTPVDSIRVPRDSNFVPVDSIRIPRDSSYIPVDSIWIPRDSIYVPIDSIKTPRDSSYLPIDSIWIPRDSSYMPVDSIRIPRDSIYVPIDSIKTPRDSSYVPVDTIKNPRDSSYVQVDSIRVPRDSSYFPIDSIRVPRDSSYFPVDSIKTPLDPNYIPVDTLKTPPIPGGNIENPRDTNDAVVLGYKFHTYPNPAIDRINIIIQLEDLENAEVRVLNRVGKVIRREKIYGSHHILDTSELESGVYILEIESHEGIKRSSFLKTN